MKFREFMQNLSNYEAGKPIELVVREFGIKEKDVIKLASNENPLGTSKKVVKALKECAKNSFLYPDDSMYELKEALAKKYSLKPQNVIIGAGSDQVIEFALHAKTDKNSGILQAGITFAMYEIYAKHTGAKVYKTASHEHNLTQFLEIYNAHKDEIGVIFLCVPNNPLGESLKRDEIYDFISKIDENTLVIIDGAYQQFAAYKDKDREIFVDDMIKRFQNVLYLGTFSKAYGLGGLRIGYGLASESIIKNLSKLRAPFNVTTLSLEAAKVALEDEEFVEKTLKNNLTQMKRYEKFAKDNGIIFIPSYTNFITFIFENLDSTTISDKLLSKGVIVRNLKSYNINAIRITIGTKSQNTRLLELLKELV